MAKNTEITTDDLLVNEDTESVEYEDTLYPDTTERETASLDDLDVAVDEAELDRREAALYLQKGIHTWVVNTDKVNCTVSLTYSDEPGKHTDVSTKGRAIITVAGTVKNKETQRTGRFAFQYSPDRRVTDNSEDDFMTINHTRLATYFKVRTGKRHKTEKELINFLQHGKYSMYITVSKTNRAYLQEFQN